MSGRQQARDGRAGVVVAILRVALPDDARRDASVVNVDELRAQAGRSNDSLEDTFLTLVAEQQAAA